MQNKIFFYRYKKYEKTCKNLYDENLKRYHTGEYGPIPKATATILSYAKACECDGVEERNSVKF